MTDQTQNTGTEVAAQEVAVQTAAPKGYLPKEIKFTFKSRKLKTDDGKEIGDAFKPDPLLATIPVPGADLLAGYLLTADPVPQTDAEGKVLPVVLTVQQKVKQLILDAVQALIKDQGKDQLDTILEELKTGRNLTVADLDFDKLSLEFIASLEPGRRGAAAITDDEWNTFFEDYKIVMVQAAGLDQKKIDAHIDIFKNPTKVKARKDMLAVLIQRLNLYAANSTKLEETGTPYQRLTGKFEKWVKEEDKLDVDAL